MQVPIEVRNLILLIGLILQVHWLLWYYFDIELVRKRRSGKLLPVAE